MKTICFFNRKGGAGKTSLSFLFARFLAASGKKVLFLDLDPQRTATNHFSRLEGIDRETYKDKNAFPVLMGKTSIEEAIIKTPDNIDLLPGSYDLAEIQATISPFAVAEILKPVKKNYDYCIQDHAPNWSNLIQAGIISADTVLIPSLPAIEDLEQTEWSFNKTKSTNPKADVKIIMNQLSKPGRLERELLDHFQPSFNGSLLETYIPATGLIRRYTATGEKITTAKAKTDFLNKFSEFVREATSEKHTPESF